mgnify:CR=1 FL=1
MKITYAKTGTERKSLVAAISQELNTPAKYLGMPTTAFEVGGYRVDKVGTVTGPDNRDLVADLQGLHSFTPVTEEYDGAPDIDQHHPGQYADPSVPPVEAMLRQADAWMEGQPAYEDLRLTEHEELGLGRERREDWQGENGMRAGDNPDYYTYQAELSDPDCPDRMEVFSAEDDEDAIRQAREFCTGEIVLLELFQLDDDYNVVRSVEIKPDRLVIQMPLTGFTPDKLDNLCKMVTAKASLLKAALGAQDLPIRQTAETLDFPWFRYTEDNATVDAYAALVSLLCKTAMEKKHVSAKEKVIDGSPRYAMRCFLLSLGFIGDAHKVARKILLSKLEGSTSRKHDNVEEAAGDE